MAGYVYLVGAGPGDPGLITVRGLECLRMADALVYDPLTAPELLKEAKEGAVLISLETGRGDERRSQAEINQLLVDLANGGKVVTWLKSGDPYVFGRGAEAAEALIAADIPFEVVPGVPSAIATLAYAGVPVTHAPLASSFAVFSEPAADQQNDGTVVLRQAAAAADTLVFLTARDRLASIVSRLVKQGRSPSTPVAVIVSGTLPEQRTIVGTLSDIMEKVDGAPSMASDVVVVGEVVRLREKLRGLEAKPLFGLRVLVTRSRDQADSISSLLRKQGAFPVEFPVIATVPPEDFAPLDGALGRLAANDWVIFTSVNGVRAVISRLWSSGQDVRAFGKAKLCAIGPATAAELERAGLRVDFMPEEYVAEAILDGIDDVAGKRILLARADLAREKLAVELGARGGLVEQVVAYRTVAPMGMEGDSIRDQLAAGQLDVVTFTSSSTVKNFAEIIGRASDGLQHGGGPARQKTDLSAIMAGTVVACIGPITARTARDLGLSVDIQAADYTIPGLVEAIVRWRERRREDGNLAR